MFNISLPRLPSLKGLVGSAGPSVKLPTVEIHDVETAAEKRPRTLKHLLRANHANHSVIYREGRARNGTAELLGAAYMFGASAEQMNEIYDKESEQLEPWRDAPGEISRYDWRDFLGKREYQRAYIDFFEDQLVQYSYDWKKMLEDFLFAGDEPLINNFVAGIGHPLVHLSYAYELKSRTLAIEALALNCCYYNFLHKYLNDPKYTRPSANPTSSLTEIFERVAVDKRFNDLFDGPGSANIEGVFEHAEEAILEHWNSWQIGSSGRNSGGPTSPTASAPPSSNASPQASTAPTPSTTRPSLTAQFAEAQKLATILLLAKSSSGDRKRRYDFYLSSLLTTTHALRVLIPLIPSRWHAPLLRQWLLFALSIFIAQLRPPLRTPSTAEDELVDDLEDGRGWHDVANCVLKGRYSGDVAYVSVLRSFQAAGQTWREDRRFYLAASVRFATEFDGWGGFGRVGGEEEARLHTRSRAASVVVGDVSGMTSTADAGSPYVGGIGINIGGGIGGGNGVGGNHSSTAGGRARKGSVTQGRTEEWVGSLTATAPPVLEEEEGLGFPGFPFSGGLRSASAGTALSTSAASGMGAGGMSMGNSVASIHPEPVRKTHRTRKSSLAGERERRRKSGSASSGSASGSSGGR
ncbi:hypothetical protein HDK77DRAFT_10948 [Phyllosticta capitalensis]|uniref:Uncharacterized protein n=1 Tax=Phyllosticta capitalensis TaxID=121624 RepID=A0ABR1YYJ0_9PEZI